MYCWITTCSLRMDESGTFEFSADFATRPEIKQQWEENGYFIIRNLLTTEETNAVKTALEKPDGVCQVIHTRDDGQGRHVRVALWNQPGNDVTGMVARSEKVAGTLETMLEGEVYHYHTKVIMKEAGDAGSGAFNWHQDYGYWYENGVIYPNLGTVWIAIDRADRGNGCLQILKGSHKVGRIEHHRRGEQACADAERVGHVTQFCDLIHVELDPGDAVFFHCNILHQSLQNNSDRRRWAFLVSYNKADNNPVKKHHHPCYTPLQKVPNSAILENADVTDFSGKDYWEDTKKSLSLLPRAKSES